MLHKTCRWNLTKLKQLHTKFDIPRIRKPPPLEVARQAVIDKVQMDVRKVTVQTTSKPLQQEGIMIPRDTVHKIMLEHFPLGFDNRFPGKKKSTIPRTALNSNGPFHEVSSDGHEKLAIPIQMTMDKGSEIGWQYAIQDAFGSHAFAPEIDPEVYPVCRLIKRFWCWLKEKMGLNLKAIILVARLSRFLAQTPLFYWIFIPLLQAQLEEFRLWWNHPRVHTQKDKNMPSGHVPSDAFDHPQNFGGLDCQIPVPKAAVDDLREMVTEDVGSRDAHLSCREIYAQIGKPTLSLQTAWEVFQAMLEPMAIVIES
ncbi:hypothetical protein B0H10DRAFT_2167416 [Mycena sp. CBHHK59/15]|nr:hypothetical protein B0H10DRAFT_2167416 [Mycena sp. CBHHK59/15]